MEEIIVQKEDNVYLIYVLEDNKIVEKTVFCVDNSPKIGDIYVGKVDSKNAKSNTVFVDIGLDKNGYFQPKDMDKFKIGEKLAFEVIKPEVGKKGVKLCESSGNENVEFSKIDRVLEANKIDDFITSIIRESTNSIYVNDRALCSNLKKILKSFKGQLVFEENADFVDKFGLKGQVSKINDKKIWLKSGAYIVIEKTEALWAIDVNSGKNEGKKGQNKEEFIFTVNTEAALEIMRQIRLKNLGGTIIIDFINMKKIDSKKQILDIMKQEAKKDRSLVVIDGFTKLGLVEIARKML